MISSKFIHVAALLVVGALAIAAVRHLDFREIGRALASASPVYLMFAAAANILALAMQSGRWLAVVHPVAPEARPRDAFFALVAGYAIGLLIPARASDLARAHLLSRRHGGSTATLTTTAVVDHLIGSVALFAALGIAALAWPVPPWIRRAGAVASCVAIAGLIALWFLRPRGDPPPCPVPSNRIAAFVRRLRRGLLAVGRPRALGIAILFAIAGWISEGLIAHLALRAFGLPSGVGPSAMAVVATTLAAAASVSPGNAGAFEVACIAALAAFGVSHEAAFAFAIGYHAVHLIPTAMIGGGWLLGHGYRPSALRGLT